MRLAIAKMVAVSVLTITAVGLVEDQACSAPGGPKDGCDTKCRDIPGPFIVGNTTNICFRFFPNSCTACFGGPTGYRCKSKSPGVACLPVTDSDNQPYMIDRVPLLNDDGDACAKLCDIWIIGYEAVKNNNTYDGTPVQEQQAECSAE
ncbi:hypothetical protein [Zavarzinella formosa]|uniref:hypothetical protein n=1 Tax=Zavarzinella formosa TaxID=360055 RepID=UPI0012F8F5D7|nr:hypothetical protein [Zavarzinella formosa]